MEASNGLGADGFLGIEHYTITRDNPYFTFIISQRHLRRKVLPRHIRTVLPKKVVPTTIQCFGRNWDLTYYGNRGKNSALSTASWRKLLDENDLKVDHGCTFELLEYNDARIVLKVILVQPSNPTSPLRNN